MTEFKRTDENGQMPEEAPPEELGKGLPSTPRNAAEAREAVELQRQFLRARTTDCPLPSRWPPPESDAEKMRRMPMWEVNRDGRITRIDDSSLYNGRGMRTSVALTEW